VSANVTEYPFLFFPVGLNLRGRRCVVVGNDREAREKSEALREVGAEVVRILDPSTLREEELSDAFFVITTPFDEVLSAKLRALADKHRFLLCAIDQPQHGFVAMQAIVKSGPARIAISTGGVSPSVGSKIKRSLQSALGTKFARFMHCLNAQRERNRVALQDGDSRRSAMRDAADGFGLEVAVTYPEWFEEGWAALAPRSLTREERATGA
jgi:siroheme synthase (precorrin-2 oxidase/ferrochelatase)